MEMNNSFSAVPANGGPPPNQMSYSNGTPPASEMSGGQPPAGPGSDQAKTTLWYVKHF